MKVNRYLRRPVQRADIVWSYAGVRPLFEVGGARDSDLSTLTRDYSFDIEHRDGHAPVLSIFGGKLTTHRRLAAAALAKLAPFLHPGPGRTAEEILPGGDFGPDGLEGFAAALERDFPWLPEGQIRRYTRLYGTRARLLLDAAGALTDLGSHFGADLYQREVDFLTKMEWRAPPRTSYGAARSSACASMAPLPRVWRPICAAEGSAKSRAVSRIFQPRIAFDGRKRSQTNRKW